MQYSSIARLGKQHQSIIDDWFNEALADPLVGPYLGVVDYRPIITIPDNDWEGFVLIDEGHQGVIKIYFNRETMTASMGMWVLTQQTAQAKARITASLVMELLNVMSLYPRFTHMSATVAQDNIQSLRITTSVLGKPWGTEPHGAYNFKERKFTGLVHFQTPMDELYTRIRKRFPRVLGLSK